ncbi:nucleoid-associated protein [Endozoicomonas numazuensis]|uniref:Nucleoid-associated protein NdpA n=1 Tax=Endozoicomonas numazuensis TaxID=1137799 RepID=A0A081NKJ3_9GAMM|nr:nucleoid-associated protein [Endozoicomonas numazuensis]KEQ18966.1 hypothetical protein GZ78_02650 [Endozoicomonas numazuensis]
MAIQQIIVHQLEQVPGSDSLTAIPAGHSLPPTPALEAMLDDLLQTYNKKQDKQYGQFNPEAESPFPTELGEYLEEKIDFTALTQNTLNQLLEKLDQVGALGGGYLLFADYQQGLTRYFMLCMLTSNMSVTVTEDLSIQDVAYLDTAKMPLACRINITEWQGHENSGRYLSFLRPRGGRRLSDVFQDALGCNETSNSKEEADTLVSAVKDYAKEAPSLENHKEVSRQVYDFCQTKIDEGDALTLDELTGYLSDAGSDDFARFVNTRDYDMSQPMAPEKRTLTKLVKYTGRSKGLNIAFDAELLGTQVVYNKDLNQLVIKEVPDKLKEQLEGNH